MKISEVFPSKYITAADLQGRTITLTIKAVTLEEMITHDSKKANKPVAWFERTEKGFVMNMTNAKTIAKLHGDDTSGWGGKRISLYPTRVKAFGSIQDCIRVREEVPPAPKPPVQAAQVEEPTGVDDDEDVADFEEDAQPRTDTSAYEDPDVLFMPDTGPERATQEQLDQLDKLGKAHYGESEWEAKLEKLVDHVTTGATSVATQLKPSEADRLIKHIQNKLAAAVQSTNGAKPVANGVVAK